ncbi:MAG: hypothetical protein WCH21_12505, partial [Bacteroidota bacterium]
KDISEFRRVVLGTSDYYEHLKERIKFLKKGVLNGNVNAVGLLADIKAFETKKLPIDIALNGDASLAKHEFETLPGLIGSVEGIVSGSWSQTMGPTQTMTEKYTKIKTEFKPIYNSILELKAMLEAIELKAENLKIPATHGRLPVFEK